MAISLGKFKLAMKKEPAKKPAAPYRTNTSVSTSAAAARKMKKKLS